MEQQKGKLLDGIAKMLNAGGSALVSAYDAGSAVMGGAYKAVKRTAEELPAAVKNAATGGTSKLLPKGRGALQSKIREYEKKIERLYYEIGKESAKYADMAEACEGETVQNLIALTKEYESEIVKLKQCIAPLEEKEREKQGRGGESREKPCGGNKEEPAGEQALADLVMPLMCLLSAGDREIRQKALGALRIITGQDVEFDIDAPYTGLSERVEELKVWWTRKMPGVEAPSAPAQDPADIENAGTSGGPIASSEKMESDPESAEETVPGSIETTDPPVSGNSDPDAGEVGNGIVQTPWPREKGGKETTSAELNKMPKAELLKLCKKRGIEGDEAMTKAEIIKLILDH